MGDATACARVVVEELLGRGVRDVVLAPGSRSAPLAYELFEADRIGLLRLHVRIDERGAAYLALGLAKATSSPVVVVTTSGTAAANLHPAVLEAWHSHVPVVVATASRPRALVHTGSNQTADQDRLFGGHVVAQATLSDAAPDTRGWRFEVARLLAAAGGARSRRPGPVHLNLEFSEPLMPADPGPISPGPPVEVDPLPEAGPAVRLTPGPQTVIVAGDDTPDRGRRIADRAAAAQVPLLAEPSSNARRGTTALATGRLLLGTALAEEIERVVVVGRPTLSRPVTRLLSRDDVEVVVVSPWADWIDPGRAASRVVGEVDLDGLGDQEWAAGWRDLDAALGRGLSDLLAALPYLSGPAVAAELWQGLEGRDVLFVGPSNPVRDLDLAAISADPPAVWANRGLAGIDGCVSTAVGIALAAERPSHALLGDLTALHDLTALLVGPAEPRPDLRLVVANDDGGSIFATLDHGLPAHAASYERLFGTPHRADFAHLAAAVGARHRRVESVTDLREVLAEPPVGLDLVEVVVDRSQRRTLDRAITGLAATLGACG